VNAITKPFLSGDLGKNLCDFHIFFSFFLVFNNDFIIYIDFTSLAASNTATDEVTNYVTHKVFNTNVYYFCAHSINQN